MHTVSAICPWATVLVYNMASSATKHWLAVQDVMRYLQSTIDVALTFNGSGNEIVVGVYPDADFGTGVKAEECVRHGVENVWGLCVLAF